MFCSSCGLVIVFWAMFTQDFIRIHFNHVFTDYRPYSIGLYGLVVGKGYNELEGEDEDGGWVDVWKYRRVANGGGYVRGRVLPADEQMRWVDGNPFAEFWACMVFREAKAVLVTIHGSHTSKDHFWTTGRDIVLARCNILLYTLSDHLPILTRMKKSWANLCADDLYIVLKAFWNVRLWLGVPWNIEYSWLVKITILSFSRWNVRNIQQYNHWGDWLCSSTYRSSKEKNKPS